MVSLMSAELIGRENPHTQATAISWLVSSLYTKLSDSSRTEIAFETCVQWMIDYESYPLDAMLLSLKTALKKNMPGNSDERIESQVKQVLEEYYDRKIS
jgi:hypothetical protein